MLHADLLLVHAGQLLVLPGGAEARRGPGAGRLGIVTDGAMAVRDGKVVWTGPSAEVPKEAQACRPRILDAGGRVVSPGFVDPHTHPVFRGTREKEYAARAEGRSYMEIAAEGGGIASTVRTTRSATDSELAAALRRHLDWMLASGTTTVEVKSGYGLDPETEIRSLRVVRDVAASRPGQTLVPTFLGPHALPPDWTRGSSEFIDMMIGEVLPVVARENLAEFADVFCEEGAFTAEESGRFLRAAAAAGLRPRLHADEFTDGGGAALAVEVSASSADHLLRISDEGLSALAASGTVAVLLPGTAFFLGLDFPDGRRFLDSGAAVALATDFNPGSCYCTSMPFIISTAIARCGFTVEEALTAATANAAVSLGLGGRKGTLAPGADADFIVWDLDDYRGIPYHLAAPDIQSVHWAGRTVLDVGGACSAAEDDG